MGQRTGIERRTPSGFAQRATYKELELEYRRRMRRLRAQIKHMEMVQDPDFAALELNMGNRDDADSPESMQHLGSISLFYKRVK